ncbi:amino acid ABC transporter permease (plasmid) [Pantoea sp. C3]|uniref:amino acid ABC transporter permease n=1 Tax=Pantoea phytostimulans TaxID=2769024 RepID=UPI0038F6D1E2
MDFQPLTLLQGQYLGWIIKGIENTLSLFFLCLVTAFVIALALTAMRLSRIALFRWFVIVFVEYHRNVPALVQLLLWYFGISMILPEILSAWINKHSSEFLFAYVALSLNSAAFMSEDLRSGVRSIASGQMEACKAMGFSFMQSMIDIILPQSVRVSIPPLISQALTLYKATSLAMAISVTELTYAAKEIDNETFRTFESYAIISMIYLIGAFIIVSVGFSYERFNSRSGVNA